jgi:hypothetical protein
MIRSKLMPVFFILNGGCGEESEIPERQRESVRDRALLEERDSVGNKIDR